MSIPPIDIIKNKLIPTSQPTKKAASVLIITLAKPLIKIANIIIVIKKANTKIANLSTSSKLSNIQSRNSNNEPVYTTDSVILYNRVKLCCD